MDISRILAQIKGILPKTEAQKIIQSMFKATHLTKVNIKMHEHIKRLTKRYLHGHGFFLSGETFSIL